MVLLHPSSTTLSLATPSSSSAAGSSSSHPPSLKHARSLTSLLAEAPPSTSPQKIFRSKKYLPKPNFAQRLWVRFVTDGGSGVERKRGQWSEERRSEERERVRGAGTWAQKGEEGTPSDLFLDIYGSVLQTLNHEPRSGLVSPSLLGTTGTLPLSIISLIPDIMAHYGTCIKNAKHEVLLFTNYWQPSDSQKTISDSLRELSRKVGERGGKKVIVKLVYDRGTFKQLIHNHSPVAPADWSAIDLPTIDEIPNLDMQVVNYHRPIVGTFHSKFLVVDREIGLLNSNNIQDRPNLEMMMHLEGPIVQSLYDTALISFANPLVPTLPLLTVPPSPENLAGFGFQDRNPWLTEVPLSGAAEATRRMLEGQGFGASAQNLDKKPGRMKDLVRAIIEKEAETPAPPPKRMSWFEDVGEGLGGRLEGLGLMGDGKRSAPGSRSNSRGPSRRTSVDVKHGGDLHQIPRHPHSENAPTTVASSTHPVTTTLSSHTEDSALPKRAVPSITSSNQVQTPLHTPPESPALGTRAFASSPEPIKNDTPTTVVGESEELSDEDARVGRVPVSSQKPHIKIVDRQESEEVLGRLAKMTKRLNAGVLSEPLPTVDDSDAIDQFMPHMLHAPHKPFPMVLVNRKPRGMPGHQDLRNPQNAAWLAGFKFAKKRVFIQTPTWNARPAVDAAIDACRRGVEVILYIGLGFNDKGESIPFQGGTNEEVVVRMYNTLRPEGKEELLKCYWYVGKDQSRPLNAAIKQRNCHVKLAIFDDCVGMAGNGNQDTQSWYHSQEVNVLLDSRQICEDWLNGLHHNQNTSHYGRIDPKDGVWRDAKGQTVAVLDRLKEDARLALEKKEGGVTPAKK